MDRRRVLAILRHRRERGEPGAVSFERAALGPGYLLRKFRDDGWGVLHRHPCDDGWGCSIVIPAKAGGGCSIVILAMTGGGCSIVIPAMTGRGCSIVIPANAGSQERLALSVLLWVPDICCASSGMTGGGYCLTSGSS